MKVLDLFCAQDHTFEGWFASEDDFQSQRERGLVQCPLCGSGNVRKGLSAPRLNLGATAPAETPRKDTVEAPAVNAAVMGARAQAAWLQLARHVIAHTEDVGSGFAQEARRMHYGEAEERAIRGQATARETAELLEEGVPVVPLLLPESAKETLQ